MPRASCHKCAFTSKAHMVKVERQLLEQCSPQHTIPRPRNSICRGGADMNTQHVKRALGVQSGCRSYHLYHVFQATFPHQEEGMQGQSEKLHTVHPLCQRLSNFPTLEHASDNPPAQHARHRTCSPCNTPLTDPPVTACLCTGMFYEQITEVNRSMNVHKSIEESVI